MLCEIILDGLNKFLHKGFLTVFAGLDFITDTLINLRIFVFHHTLLKLGLDLIQTKTVYNRNV